MEPPSSTTLHAESARDWERVSIATFGGLRLTELDEGVRGTIALARFGEASLARVVSARQRVARVPARDSLAKTISVLVQLAGSCQVRTARLDETLEAGRFALVDGEDAFELEFDGAFEQVLLQLPRTMLGAVAPQVRRSRRASDPASAADRYIADAVATMAARAPELEARHRETVLSSVVQLLPMASSLDVAEDARTRRFERALGDLDRLACDPATTPARIADAQGVSRRHLDEIFASAGTTVAREIWERRLQRAAAELRAPANARRTVLDVALSVGFADAASFSRAFKRRFGVTPLAHRRQG